MSKFLRAAIVVTAIAWGATAAQAQTVAMAGQYSEGNGIIVNIPQNPPNVPCSPTTNARCTGKRQYFGPPVPTPTGPILHSGPQVGVRGARLIPNGALTAGAAFTIPPLAFTQRLGLQAAPVLNNTVVQLDTAFTAAMPGTMRSKLPPVETRNFAQRSFSVANVAAHGQNNGLSTGDPNYEYRQGITSTITDVFGTEMLNMQYRNGGFTGTMTVLLDGAGRLYLAGAGLDAAFPASLRPIVGTNPVGDDIPGLNVRNAAGWKYTVTGSQMEGLLKGFPSHPSIVGTPCIPTAPPSPVGCNFIGTPGGGKWDDLGFGLAPLRAATSTKFMFAWTTGTVSIVRTAVRRGVTVNDTQTGMGYDTVTAMGQRNVGLVAGSYTKRTDDAPSSQMNLQLVGASLKFTPEPGATVALLSGLGLLGAFATRRRN